MVTNLHDFFYSNNNMPEVEAYCRGVFEASPIDMASVVAEARKQLLDHASTKGPNYITRNFMSGNMHSNMVGVLYERYPELMQEDQEGCAYLKLADNLRVYPKKLSDKYLPGNIPTKHVKSKYGQELYSDDTKIHVLYAGPVLEKEDWTLDFRGVYASFINEYNPKKAAFIIDLSDLAKPMGLGVESIAPNGPQTPLVRVPGVADGKERKAN